MAEEHPTGHGAGDPEQPSIARVYDAMLGGTDNFPADRAVAAKIQSVLPISKENAWRQRELLARGVRHLANEGIDQFLDLGSGLPTVQNTHQIVQALNPDARVVYVDNDPAVFARGRVLLADDPRSAVVTADLRDVDVVLDHPEVCALVDFDRPVGLLMVGVLHHFADADDPGGVVKRYLDAVPSGSRLFLTHFRANPPVSDDLEKVFLTMLGSGRFRTQTEIEAYFDGLVLDEPGVVAMPLWKPDGPVAVPLDTSGEMIAAGSGRKP
ncbi:SAM-dependent methyltransferase [Yinghuangia aomiensis]|uniref:SAM-dependent methyltransferase n=1 Tax=Yinghuangia aomiensis TaxID=676205 RepID=A0ABP9HLJ6_9ACTN